jgi:hypothetical protein
MPGAVAPAPGSSPFAQAAGPLTQEPGPLSPDATAVDAIPPYGTGPLDTMPHDPTWPAPMQPLSMAASSGQENAMPGTPVSDPLGEPGLRQETLGEQGHRATRRKAGPAQRLGMAKVAVIGAAAAVIVGGGGVAVAMSASGDDGSGTVRPQAVADAAQAPQVVDPAVAQAQQRDQALARAKRAARGDKRKPPTLVVKGTPKASKTPTADAEPAPVPAGNPVPKGEAQRIAKEMLPSFGFDPDTQFGCLVKLWDRESGWRTTAGNPSSGAYGIPQALPGSKMASAGSDWRTSAKTQIKWGLGYIKGRYSNPCGAWSAFQSKGWY